MLERGVGKFVLKEALRCTCEGIPGSPRLEKKKGGKEKGDRHGRGHLFYNASLESGLGRAILNGR